MSRPYWFKAPLIAQVRPFLWSSLQITFGLRCRCACYDRLERFRSNPVNDPATCRHTRTKLIAKDSDAEYVECLDCGVIIESSELPEPSAGFNESLSDA